MDTSRESTVPIIPGPNPDETRAGEGLWGARLFWFERLPSTNRWALDHADRLVHGDVVQADHQTAGRGRFDRIWISPPGTCLTLSVILTTPRETPPPLLGQAAALAVVAALRRHAIDASVKWPNDVLVNQAKVAGILGEQDAAGRLVLGIGLNVNLTADQLAAMQPLQPATSLFAAAGIPFDLIRLRRSLLSELESMLRLMDDYPDALVTRWAEHDALTGSRITVATERGHHEGVYLGMDQSGRLRLRQHAGDILEFWTGDVRRCRREVHP